MQPALTSQCLHQVARGFSSSDIANSLQHRVQPLQPRPSTICRPPVWKPPWLVRAGHLFPPSRGEEQVCVDAAIRSGCSDALWDLGRRLSSDKLGWHHHKAAAPHRSHSPPRHRKKRHPGPVQCRPGCRLRSDRRKTINRGSCRRFRSLSSGHPSQRCAAGSSPTCHPTRYSASGSCWPGQPGIYRF